MKVYKRLIYLSSLITVFAFVFAVVLNFCCKNSEDNFWINVLLGIFGSAFLTLLTSICFYSYERRNTLESFLFHTKQILSYLNKYKTEMSLEEKIKFFLDYSELDKMAWDTDYGKISFFFDHITGNYKYIYNKIYYPIVNLNSAISKYIWNFRCYLDGTVKNDEVIQKIIDELQNYFIEITEKDMINDYDANEKPISFCHCSYFSNSLVNKIFQELNGKYYEILYGKIKAKEINLQEDENDGQVENANE